MNNFTSEYYKSVNYVDYLDRGDRYDRIVNELLDLLQKINLIDLQDKTKYILDFGCAVGHVLNALEKRNLRKAYGVDISEWALEYAWEKGLAVQKEVSWHEYHSLVFALDVFEHMPLDDLNAFFEQIKTDSVVFKVPVCKNSGEDYVLQVSRNDPTHVIRWTKNEWKSFFTEHGYFTLDLNLYTIYNSEGVYTGLAIRV